ncbi:MAG TPA: aldo/keto reductase, partial [Solirubrobacteraceae bacterium]|nr:aldo/keto reductase [Solirubrobacteraceae bacterium]
MPDLPTRELGKSGLGVSIVGLGCNNFGRRIDLEATRAVVDAALEEGVTFFDTSNTYGRGQSEEYLGEVLQGRRDAVVLATKFGMDMGDGKDPGARGSTSIRPVTRRSSACGRTRSTSTGITSRTASPPSRRRSRPFTSSSRRARCVRSAP